MTTSQVLQAHGLKTQDEADELLVRLVQDRDMLLTLARVVAEHFADTDAPLGRAARIAIAHVEAHP